MTADGAGAVLDAIRARADAAWKAQRWDVPAGTTYLNAEMADYINATRIAVPRLLAAVDAVLGLTRDEWGSRTDDGERCSYCRRKWSKHHEGDDETHYRISDAINAHYRATVAAITEALTRKEEA